MKWELSWLEERLPETERLSGVNVESQFIQRRYLLLANEYFLEWKSRFIPLSLA